MVSPLGSLPHGPSLLDPGQTSLLCPPHSGTCMVVDYSSFPDGVAHLHKLRKGPGGQGLCLIQSPNDLAEQDRSSTPCFWSMTSPHLSPASALCSSSTEPLVIHHTHHASSSLPAYTQANPSYRTPFLSILHLTPTHPSKPQPGISMETAAYPTPTPTEETFPSLGLPHAPCPW